MTTAWSTGLCDCFEDSSNCCLTCCCPCITFGRIAEVVDEGTTSCGTSGTIYSILCVFTGCQWILGCMYRSKLRQKHTLRDEPCNDCLLHCCCHYCALCQEYRELKHRGYDPANGYPRNLSSHGGGVVGMAPTGPGEMKR
uniref:cell number regulator 2-like n=1 Tax=Erigeron canadensis TaxID=72917 RepID=UPI001CB9D7D4|nr:cell number regulator 2-like [Erigeron canadensis]